MCNKIFCGAAVFFLAVSLTAAEENPVALDPAVKSAADSLTALFNSGKRFEALREINRYVLQDSVNSQYFAKIRWNLEKTLTEKETLELNEKILTYFPDWIGVEDYLTIIYFRRGDWDNFKKHLKAYYDKGACGDMIAEYNYNTLIGLDSNAIIFSNGDNDTFPFWYWQYIKGFRQDVTLINLAQLNNADYIKVISSQKPQVEISYTYDLIDILCAFEDTLAKQILSCPGGTAPQELHTSSGIFRWEMPATIHRDIYGDDQPGNNSFRLQDLMVLDIIVNNMRTRPIYFTTTCSNVNLLGLKKYLSMEGLMFRLTFQENKTIDPEKLWINLFEKYKFEACRKFPDIRHQTLDKYYQGPLYPPVESEIKISQNYRSAFAQLAHYYSNKDEAGKKLKDSAYISRQYKDFDALSSKAKALYILLAMDYFIPEARIPYTSENVKIQLKSMKEQLQADAGK